MKKLLLFIPLLLMGCSKDEPKDEVARIKDGSGNIYSENIIGNQVWLKEDLKTTKYIDGVEIPSTLLKHDSYGNVYYSYSVDLARVAPEGYKVPSKSEMKTLIDYFGGKNISMDNVKKNYLSKWNAHVQYISEFNIGSGFYWHSSGYLYFRTTADGESNVSADNYEIDDFFNLKLIKK